MPYAVYFCGEFDRFENSRPVISEDCDTVDWEKVETNEAPFELWEFLTDYKKFPCMVKTYETKGPMRGMTKEKVYFQKLEDAKRFYVTRFEYRNFSYNPTMWEKRGENWVRICGF